MVTIPLLLTLFSLLSKSADELLARNPEMQALERDAEASRKMNAKQSGALFQRHPGSVVGLPGLSDVR